MGGFDANRVPKGVGVPGCSRHRQHREPRSRAGTGSPTLRWWGSPVPPGNRARPRSAGVTFLPHPHTETLLQAAVLALVAVVLVDLAVAVGPADRTGQMRCRRRATRCHRGVPAPRRAARPPTSSLPSGKTLRLRARPPPHRPRLCHAGPRRADTGAPRRQRRCYGNRAISYSRGCQFASPAMPRAVGKLERPPRVQGSHPRGHTGTGAGERRPVSRHVAGGKRRSGPPASPPDVRGISRNFNYFLRGRGCPRGAEPVTPRARALAGVRHGPASSTLRSGLDRIPRAWQSKTRRLRSSGARAPTPGVGSAPARGMLPPLRNLRTCEGVVPTPRHRGSCPGQGATGTG